VGNKGRGLPRGGAKRFQNRGQEREVWVKKSWGRTQQAPHDMGERLHRKNRSYNAPFSERKKNEGDRSGFQTTSWEDGTSRQITGLGLRRKNTFRRSY